MALEPLPHAEMTNGSMMPSLPHTHSAPSAPVPMMVGISGGSTRHSTQFILMMECELCPSMDREHKVGGKTEVKPDSMGDDGTALSGSLMCSSRRRRCRGLVVTSLVLEHPQTRDGYQVAPKRTEGILRRV